VRGKGEWGKWGGQWAGSERSLEGPYPSSRRWRGRVGWARRMCIVESPQPARAARRKHHDQLGQAQPHLPKPRGSVRYTKFPTPYRCRRCRSAVGGHTPQHTVH
jgi:hypothetical protein